MELNVGVRVGVRGWVGSRVGARARAIGLDALRQAEALRVELLLVRRRVRVRRHLGGAGKE